MTKLFCFMMSTLDGYYEGPNQEFDWPTVDGEFNEFAVSQLNDIGVLLFGRVTYEGMASYWPTDEARENDPEIADLMNTIPKVVFSTTLTSAGWNNATVASGDAATAIAELREEQPAGKDLALFGSSELTARLMEGGLVDELRVIVSPVLLGAGTSLFRTLAGRVRLEHLRTTTFRSGNVLVCYRPSMA